MENDILIDFAILLLRRDKIRTAYVNNVVQKYPYFRIVDAVDAAHDWPEVEKTFIDNGIKVTDFFDPRVGKFGRWASFIKWLVWVRDFAQPNGIQYAVLAEDDLVIKNSNFKLKLVHFVKNTPNCRFVRCGPYNSCLLVKSDFAAPILDRIRETGVDMPDDWWTWKSGKVLQHNGPSLVDQNPKLRSNIKVKKYIPRYLKEMWECDVSMPSKTK